MVSRRSPGAAWESRERDDSPLVTTRIRVPEREFDVCRVMLPHGVINDSAPGARDDLHRRLPELAAASLARLLRWQSCWRPAFPNSYLFFSLFCLCDFVQTCFILSVGGAESNELAQWMMQQWGLAGAALYKGALMALVIVIIEWSVSRDNSERPGIWLI